MFSVGVITDQVSMDFEKALSFIRDLGMDDIEIHALWNKNIEDLSDSEVEKAHGLVKKYGMKVSLISSTLFLLCPLEGDDKEYGPIDDYFITISGSYDSHMSALKRCIELCRVFGTDKIRTFGFIKENEFDESTAVQKVTERLRGPVDMAEAAGITIVLENCPHTYLTYGKQTAKVIRAVGSKSLKALWDPGNTLRAGGTPFPEDYRAIRGEIAHVHAKDLSLESAQHMVPLGEGVINYQGIVQALIEDGYSGVVSLEPEYDDEKGGRPEGVRRAYEGIKKAIGSI